MNALLSQIVFMQPIMLTALMVLPLIWYLLRVTPPAPKTIIFPPTRFLEGLVADNNHPSKSPWWILLLRLLILAMIIVALAKPVINPADSLSGKGAVRIIMDNSWGAAKNWDMQISSAKEVIAQAGREQREIYILATTPAIGKALPKQHGPVSQSEAISILLGLNPNPWATDYKSLIKTIEKNKENKSIYSIWFSHGLDEGGIKTVISAVQNQGGLSYLSPKPEKLPFLLRPTKKTRKSNKNNNSGNIKIDIDAPSDFMGARAVSVQALAQKNDIVDIQSVTLKSSDLPKTVEFDVLENLKNSITKFKISNSKGAGAIYLLDDNFKKRKVGIASPAQKELSAPLIDESYYIKRALEPYADILISEISKLIKENMSVIILPDISGMPADTLNELEKWVKDGGLLLRFSGENIAKAQDGQFLLPVKLRAGKRSLSGSLSWDENQTIAEFPDNSPFYGLDISDDITIRQYVLADPDQDLTNKVWARLSDGTPFITAKSEGRGLIALIHTSANTKWSDFALSGLYVSVLKKIIRLSGQNSIIIDSSYSSLDPLLVMDGYGVMGTPPPSVAPIPAGDLGKIVPSSIHPPGIYGSGKMQYALNIGTNLPKLKATSDLPLSVKQSYYQQKYEISLMPFILYTALILFLIDWLIMIFIAGSGFRAIFKTFAFILSLAILSLTMLSSTAVASNKSDIELAEGFHLAYIKTGDESIDLLSENGLDNLAQILTRRTSVEPLGIVGIDPENDAMAFFPLIYWAIDANQKDFSSKALENIQSYLDHGGTILFDTRDQNRTTGNITNTPNAKALRVITTSLNIPPIIPIPKDHVLGRSFYLLNEYPGQYSAGTLWIEKNSASGRDNVSSVLIGSNDWASAWAVYGKNRGRESRQRELAMRFGVNLVMYSLTGNYKADQVHIPHILKRLGK